MTDNTTKVISARVPMGSYVQILAAASELKMTIADFVLLKLFAQPDPSASLLQQANQQLQQSKAQVVALETDNAQLTQSVKNWMDQAEVNQIDGNIMFEEKVQASRQVNQLSQELAQLRAQNQTLTQQRQTAQDQLVALQKRVQDLHAALTQADKDASTRLGQLSDKHWAIINRFIKL